MQPGEGCAGTSAENSPKGCQGSQTGDRRPSPEPTRLHSSSSPRAMHLGPCAGGAAQGTSLSCCKRKWDCGHFCLGPGGE